MADNYLEKKMEELRSPKQRLSSAEPSKRSRLPWALPQLRVAVVNGCSAEGVAVAELFAGAGLRVTAIDPRRDAGKQMASLLGIRYAEADTSSPESLRTALDSTLRAWRDIDAVICLDMPKHLLTTVAGALSDYRRIFPRISSYESRIILVTAGAADRETAGALEMEGNIIQEIVAEEDTAPDTSARLCLFLALPVNSSLHRITV